MMYNVKGNIFAVNVMIVTWSEKIMVSIIFK